MAPRSTARTPPALLLALFSARDIEQLVDAAFALLRATVACDFTSAFYRSAGNGLLKGRDSKGRRYDSDFMRTHVELNPAIPLVMAQRGVKLLPTRTGLPTPDGMLKQMAFYREVMRPLGWRHSVALCFWGNPPGEFPIVVASTERREGRRDFTQRDVARLTEIRPFLEAAVNQLHEREQAQLLTNGLGGTTRTSASKIVIVDRAFRLIHASPGAHRLYGKWTGGAKLAGIGRVAPRHLPFAVVDACRALSTEWEALIKNDPDAIPSVRRRQISCLGHPELTALITMVSPAPGGVGQPMFVVDFRRHQLKTTKPAPSAPVLGLLTETERGIAVVIGDGLSNQEIAERLGKTIHAVKFLLHRIYMKTGLPNRAALVAALRSPIIDNEHQIR